LQPVTHWKKILFHKRTVGIVLYFSVDDLVELHVVKINADLYD
jgi:hypothetical protein